MPPRERKLRRYVLLLLGPALLIGALVFLKFSQISLLMAKGKEDEKAGPPPESVGTAVVQSQAWEATLPAVGSVIGKKSVTVSNDAAGRVKRIRFESGAMVKQGQVLVELDTSVERAQLGAARSRRHLAQLTVNRSRPLLAKNAVPEALVDSDETNLETAKRDVAAIEAEIERKIVRAPFSGRLGIREVDIGEFLQPGTKLTVLESLGEVFVDFTLPQERIASLKVGMPVRVALQGVTAAKADAAKIDGILVAIDPTVDEDTRNVKLRASIPDPGDQLRPGMFVSVSVVLPDTQRIVAVPATAIAYASFGDSVFVVEERKPGTPGMSKSPSGKPVKIARQQFVRLGEARGDFIAVSEGLEAGQEVVTAGAFKLRNGSPIVVDNTLQPDAELEPRPENR